MKFLALLLILPLQVLAQHTPSNANDMQSTKRNSANTGFDVRYYTYPGPGIYNLLVWDGDQTFPQAALIGSGLSYGGGSIIVNSATLTPAWSNVTGKPSFATVALTGAYSDLTGTPTIPSAPVNADWNAISGLAQILNKPTLALVATSGIYSDLTGKPTIPAAQVNSDWTSVAGVSEILNKPTLGTAAATNSTAYATAAQGALASTAVQPAALSAYATTAAMTSALAGKFNTPSGTTAQYIRGDGSLAAFPTAVTPTINNNVARALNSNFTISATQGARVVYSINVAWSVTALLSSASSAFLEYSTNAGSSWITVSQVSRNLGALTLGLSGNDDLNVSGELPPNALARIRTTSSNATVTFVRAQETLY